MTGSETSAFPAMIAAAASLIVSIIGGFITIRTQAKLIKNQEDLQRYQRDLKRLDAELGEKQAERDARRDYEYEAKKRLYHECSPLIFQFSEQAASALERIRGLALSATQGNLGSGPESWLSGDRNRYYRLSTEYRLLAPLATLKLLQRRLTKLDLSLDSEIRIIYTLARQAIRVFSDDFEISRILAPIPYMPHLFDAKVLAKDDPAIYLQQGVPRGILENAIESLICKDDAENLRIISFLDFENKMKDTESPVNSALNRISYLFYDFHPETRPILWRILLATAGIYRIVGILLQRESNNASLLDIDALVLLSDDEREIFDWRSMKNDLNQGSSISLAIDASTAYLIGELRGQIQRIGGLPTKSQQTQKNH